jgi:ArsR family transcriptional regulator
MNLDEKKTAVVFKAFCDENRIRILKLLTTGENVHARLLEELNITQPTLSHHMKILCDSECSRKKRGQVDSLLYISKGLKKAKKISYSFYKD